MMTSSSDHSSPAGPLKVAWFSYFPVEWLPRLPREVESVPRQHPATWQRVLWEEFRHRPDLQLHIFSLRKEYGRSFQFERDNTTFHGLKTPGGFRAPSLYWTDTILLRRHLRRVQPDICHAWGTEFGAAIVASRLPYPALVTMQGILSWLKDVFPLNNQVKISALLEKPGLRRARVVTAESSFAIEFLRARHPHLELLQIEHAPNPLFFQLDRRPQTKPLRLLSIGHFAYDKGPDLLLEALGKMRPAPDFELIWIGSVNSKYQEELKSSVAPDLWARIQFRQHLTPAEVAEEIVRATMLVYPTRADNSPNAVKEAVVAGLPVVASRVGGIPDYVRDGENGFLFNPGDADDCLKTLEKALAHPGFREGYVGTGALQAAREYLSPQKMGAAFREAYDTVRQVYSA